MSETSRSFATAPSAPIGHRAPAVLGVSLLMFTSLLVCWLALFNWAELRSFVHWAGVGTGPLVALGVGAWCAVALLSALRLRRLARDEAAPTPSGPAAALALCVLGVLWARTFRLPGASAGLASLLWVGAWLALALLRDSMARHFTGGTAHLPVRLRQAAPAIALSLASFLVTSAGLEALARRWVGAPSPRIDAFGARPDLVVSPYVMFGERPVTAGGELNAQGFYGPEFAPTKSVDERRVALLGGSVVWAGKDSPLSIATDLEARLNRRCPGTRVRVANFGRRSYVSMQELILLQREVLPLDVDLVIVLDGFNDLWIPWRDEPEGVGHPFLFSNLRTLTEVSPTRLTLGRVRRALESHSAFVSMLTGAAARPRNTALHAPDSVATAREYGRNLYQMALLARAYGARVLIAPQPWVGSKQPVSAEEAAYLTAAELRAFAAARSVMTSAAASAAQRAGVAFADSADVFDGLERTLFDDPVHVAGRGGNTLLARFLARQVSALGLLGAGQGACALPRADAGSASAAGS